jgi:acetyl esterase/lipase
MNRIVLSVLLLGPAPLRLQAALPEPDSKPVYKTVGEHRLALHVFQPDATGIEAPRPAIVFFFGGGWVSGTPSQFYPHCQHLAARGMVAMAAEYRIKNRHGTPPSACVEDGKSALRWVRQHARELGIDPQRIAAGGGSAGGHVAAAVATTEGFERSDEDPTISCRPQALILFNPVFDNSPQGYGNERVHAYWQAISPLHNIQPGAPPTLVFLGTRDKLVPVDTADTYQRKMHAVGARCEVHLYLDQAHGFFNYRDGENPIYLQTIAEMDRFLQSLGYLGP